LPFLSLLIHVLPISLAHQSHQEPFLDSFTSHMNEWMDTWWQGEQQRLCWHCKNLAFVLHAAWGLHQIFLPRMPRDTC
jgi:hypothetical protein